MTKKEGKVENEAVPEKETVGGREKRCLCIAISGSLVLFPESHGAGRE